jgi:sec-independent protein translocase protein TatA
MTPEPVQLLAWTPFDPWHLLVLLVVALLLFGKRLPEVGRSLGKGISEFKKGLKDVRDELDKDNEEPPQKLKPPDSVARDSTSSAPPRVRETQPPDSHDDRG